MKCHYCNKKIHKDNNIYKGFDCTFCSNYCREKVINPIYNSNKFNVLINQSCQENNRINNLYIWKIDTNLKKKQSIIGLDNISTDIYSSINSNESYDFQYDNIKSEFWWQDQNKKKDKRNCNIIYNISLQNIKESIYLAFNYTITYFR